MTGGDIIKQLYGKNLGDLLLIPDNAFRTGDTVMIDDVDIKDIEKELKCKIKPSSCEGGKFIDDILF